MSIRSAKEVKRSLLKRAIQEGRGPEMILLIQWRNAFNRHISKNDLEEVQDFEKENFGLSRSVRMLNLLSKIDGMDIRFSDTDLAVMNRFSSDSIN